MSTNVKFVKLRPGAKMPARGSDYAAGYDLHACIDSDLIDVAPFETVKVGTGLAIKPPEGYFGAIFARSGLATKNGLRPANCVGVCDEDYTGEYIVAIHNDTQYNQYIHNGDRIAQLVFMPYLNIAFEQVKELDATDRGSGGFGSTGK